MNINDLKAAAYNPRKISKKAAAGLKTSLFEFGDISGIVFNSRTGNLVSGHQRLEQLKALGCTFDESTSDIITTTGSRFRVRIVDWDETREKAANLSANNESIQGTFINENLGELINDISLNFSTEDLMLDKLIKEMPFVESEKKAKTCPECGAEL